jgi:F-type H+-transporting ATPase subunit b
MAEHLATTGAPAPAEHVEATAFGLDAPGWIALAMIAVIAIMIWKKVPGAIGKALDNKIATIRRQLDEAAQLRAEAEAMIERARTEAKGIVDQAESDAAALVERRTRMAEDKIAAAERAAVEAVRAKAAAAAAAAAEQLIRSRLDTKADKAMVDAAIADLGRR